MRRQVASMVRFGLAEQRFELGEDLFDWIEIAL
jgi:hypothetical protein